MTIRFSDVQDILDAVLNKSAWAQGQQPPLDPQPHGVFWRRTGDYDLDYAEFTTGNVPMVGLPIMKQDPGEGLQSIFYVLLTDPNGLQNEAIPQMPAGGPYITDAGYQADVNDVTMTGQQIQQALAEWLTNGFPK